MFRPEANPRNCLEELLRERGVPAEHYVRVDAKRIGEHTFQATATVTLPDGDIVIAEGEVTHGATSTRLLACQAILDRLRETHPHLFESWNDLQADAQAGDALIKLAAYLAHDLPTASQASHFLQTHESNARLAEMFDSWKQANDPELRDWGMHLSDDRKGTLVEALIWRRYGSRILSDRAREELASLLTLLATPSGND